MKKLLAITLWLIAIALWMQNHQTLTNQLNIPAPYQSLYEEVLAPVVRITSPQGTGSGVIIYSGVSPSAHSSQYVSYILTAAHVVGSHSKVDVQIYDYALGVVDIEVANVLITDTAKDLALLECNSRCAYPTARLASRNYTPYLFTPIWAVGCSLGLNPRPSSGHICAICGSYWEVSAPILPGNSGGGVFLKDTHRLIGIAVWVRTYHGQLVTTMAGVVTLQDIYSFLDEAGIGQVTTIPDGQGLRCRSVAGIVPINQIYEFLKTTPLMNCDEHKSEDFTCWSSRGSDGAIGTRGPGGPTLPMKGGEKTWHPN